MEYAILEWVDGFNNRRLLEPIGNILPAEAEANFYACVAFLRYGYISVDEVKSLLGPNRYRFMQSKRLQAILRSVEFDV